MPRIDIITTEDGSHSLINTDLQETYHSVHGAIQESMHVFIQAGLGFWIAQNPGKRIRILEMGFGTGLNAFLTLLESIHGNLEVAYEAWELYPVDLTVAKQLNYGNVLEAPSEFLKVHEIPWNVTSMITPNFTLLKRLGDISIGAWPDLFDIIYYDAFAPSKQPDLWHLNNLKRVTDTLDDGGVWVTYCAKGQVKRDLRSLGLKVETLPGAPGKKEMIRALR